MKTYNFLISCWEVFVMEQFRKKYNIFIDLKHQIFYIILSTIIYLFLEKN
jgi:hypothetical protein